MGRGPVWEAMMFSSMDQFTKLWDEAYQGGLPVIFNFFNNHTLMIDMNSSIHDIYTHLNFRNIDVSAVSLCQSFF